MGDGEAEILRMKDPNRAGAAPADGSEVETVSCCPPAAALLTRPGQAGDIAPPAPAALNKENQTMFADKTKLTRRKISDFIFDKPLRVRSYMRRRAIPFKRCLELDAQCGTKSFHIQISKDIDEALYCGSKDITELFLSAEGIKLSDLNNLLLSGRKDNREEGWTDRREGTSFGDSDEEVFDTMRNKYKSQKNLKAESARKLSEVEYLGNPAERAKRFKAMKEGILAKQTELESVCGVAGLTILVNSERELLVYHGEPALVTALFTRGLRRADLPVTTNVRSFECDEVDYNACSVPGCVVSRNTLGKWRRAAMEGFLFPPSLSLCLHPCPPGQRQRWVAECDLEPTSRVRPVVCSLHFRDGRPTRENPFPSELLGEPVTGRPVYRGVRPAGGSADLGQFASLEARTFSGQVLEALMQKVEEKINKINKKDDKRLSDIAQYRNIKYQKLLKVNKRRLKKLKSKKKYSKGNPLLQFVMKLNRKPHKRRVSGNLSCKFCKDKFTFTKSLYHHVRYVHFASLLKRKATPETVITEEERRRALQSLYPDSLAAPLDPKKKYVCAVCKSVCDLHGLFIHMKTVHGGLLCQYCLKLFKKVRDLETHLAAAHRTAPRYYAGAEQLVAASGSEYSLACGECSQLVSVAGLESHQCGPARPSWDCVWCGQQHGSQCELERHIASQLCRPGPAPAPPAVLYRVLTGAELEEGRPAGALEVERWPLTAAASSTNRQTCAPAPFSCGDRGLLARYAAEEREAGLGAVLEELPPSGTVYCGPRSRGINNHVKKEFKDLGGRFSLETAVRRAGLGPVDLAVHATNLNLAIEKAGKHFIVAVGGSEVGRADWEVGSSASSSRVSKRLTIEPGDQQAKSGEAATSVESERSRPRPESKLERIERLQAEIERGLAALRVTVAAHQDCLFCQQCRTVWVEAAFLLSHIVLVHAGGQAEQAVIAAIKRFGRDTRGKEVMFRYQSEHFQLDCYRCSYCSTTSCTSYTDLFAHTAAAHATKVLTCNICQNIFLNYGSLISHVCCGPPTTTTAKARFACKMCNKMDLSSFLEFQLHIRSQHHTCEICFQGQGNQRALYHHCAQHQQDLMCMKCFVTFERPESFKKHLHSKHATEALPCGSCWAPTWPHVYHFCLPDLPVSCPACEAVLPNSGAYRVHRRRHTGATPHACPACSKGFISKSLLWKHLARRHPEESGPARQQLKERRLRRDTVKLGAASQDSVQAVQNILDGLLDTIFTKLLEEERKAKEDREAEAATLAGETGEVEVFSPPAVSALDAAILSIMPKEQHEEKVEATKSIEKEAPTGCFPQPTDRAAIQASIAGRTYTEDNSWQAGLDALLAGAEPAPAGSSGSSDSPASDAEVEKETQAPVIGGLWNQDLQFVGAGGMVAGPRPRPLAPGPAGPRIRAPAPAGQGGLRTLQPAERQGPLAAVAGIKSLGGGAGQSSVPTTTQWDLDLSEDSDEEIGPSIRRPPALKARTVLAQRPLLDHDYCYDAFLQSQQPVFPAVPETPELSEMDKILSNVAFGGYNEVVNGGNENSKERERDKKKKKKKKKKKRKRELTTHKSESSTDSGSEIDVSAPTQTVDMFGIQARQKNAPAGLEASVTPQGKRARGRPSKLADKLLNRGTPGSAKRGPKPKYHTPDAAKTRGVMAGTARPSFDTDSSGHGMSDSDGGRPARKAAAQQEVVLSDSEVGSSDLDTDWEVEEELPNNPAKFDKTVPAKVSKGSKPSLKLKIKLPPQPQSKPASPAISPSSPVKGKKRRLSEEGQLPPTPLSKKLRESLALNPGGGVAGSPSAQARWNGTARPGLYCYCQCPHDEVSEMIGCDAPDCRLEWFHFECVGILIPPEGKWFCPECTKRYGL